MDLCENTPEIKSEFKRLLESFKDEIHLNGLIVDKLQYFSNELKQIDNMVIDDELVALNITTSGIVEELWQQVYVLRRNNSILRKIALHLDGLVG